MTSSIGHPDWQTYANWRGPILYNSGLTLPANGSGILFTDAVSHFASLYLEVIGITGGCILEASFGATAATIRSSVVQAWVVQGASQLSAMFPVLGNFVQISAVQAGSAGCTANVFAIATNTPVTGTIYQATGNGVAADNEAIAAGATNAHQLGWVTEGEAYVFLDPLGSAGGLNVTVWALNQSGAHVFPIARWNGVTTILNQSFRTINYPIALEITNTAGAVQHMSYYMVTGQVD